MKIYLAGYINGKKIKECRAWRREIVEHYNNWKGIEKYPITWLDPLNGEEIKDIDPEGLTSNIAAHAIVHRDYMSIQNADIIVAQMDTFGELRSSTGTICELAWAWQMRKPILLIAKEDQYIKHPFLSYFASIIVPDVKTLLEKKYINHFYKGINDVIYE